MNEQKIVKLAKAKFLVFWTQHEHSGLLLDFNPTIQAKNLQGNFCLKHWQAKPFLLRQWGVYDSSTDNYYSCNNVIFHSLPTVTTRIESFQIDESINNCRPTAVVCYYDCIAQFKSKDEEKELIIQPLSKVQNE